MKYFSSCQTVFPAIWMLLSNLCLRELARVYLPLRVPSLICGAFKRLNCLKFLSFTIPRIGDRLIPVCSATSLGAKCVWSCSSCELTNSSIKSMFSSVETALGRPEPCLLSVEPVSLNFFNRRLT